MRQFSMWKRKKHDVIKEVKLREIGNHRLLARILSQSPVDPLEINNFLSTDYNNLNDPFKLNDVEKAARLFIQHAKNKSRIAIIGDYDCDGIVSTTMLFELCRNFSLTCIPFLPSRLDHGYGLNELTIDAFKKKVKTPPDLLFVTDCGTSNYKEIEQLKEFGITNVIVIDHHLPVKENISRNADALISWHFTNGFNEMCACGEVFQFIRGIRWLTKHVDPVEFLSYAAIGTLADSQPIIGDNRIIVKNGLTKYAFDHVMASGLNSLIKSKVKWSEVITQTDVEFRIAPMINAAGRIETPDIVFNLLIQQDHVIADEMSKKASDLNDQRKHLQSFVETSAVQKAKDINAKNGVIVCDKEYHIGVVGIVASRVVEETGLPALVIGNHKGVWKGSGRSTQNINLKEVLDECSFMFDRYGGHAAAVGVTIKEEYIDKAQEIFDKACEEYCKKNDINSEFIKSFNASLKFNAINEEMANLLKENLSPYCKDNNSEPIFQLKGVKITSTEFREGKGWRVLTFNVYKDKELLSHKFKWFSPKFDREIENEPVDIYFTFPQHWDNSKKFEQFDLTVVDIEKRS